MGHISIIMSVRVCHDSCASAPMGHISIIMSVRVCQHVRVPQWVTSV